jgi:hypothetical protein
MALIFTDPNPSGPHSTFQDKVVRCKVVQLTQANFSTAGVNQLLARLPADASILGFDVSVLTPLNNGATTPTISIGTTAGGTQFVNASAVSITAGGFAPIPVATGILQPYQVPLGSEIDLWFRGACATANPTAADVRVVIYYVR